MHITDYQIVQRDSTGFASIPFEGGPDGIAAGQLVWARALREDDSLDMTGWQRCEQNAHGWRTSFKLPAGGPYWLEARAGDEGAAPEWCPRIARVSHVGVGELFLLAGQSNMAGYGRDSAYDPPELGVHLYGNDGRWTLATHPLNDSLNTIYPENAEYPSSSSPALSFARTLRRRLNMPVGLVQASLGGSPLSRWHPEENGDLYRAMLRRIDVVGPVGGVLWYQGCSDTDTEEQAQHYLERFARMVELWRADLGELPIITVQINRVKQHGADEARDRRWGLVREAQRRAAQSIKRLVVVPSTDLACTDGIHNSSGSNVILGERMANVALKELYGQSGLSSPNLRRVVRKGARKLFLEFGEGHDMRPAEGPDDGMNVEDAQGLIRCSACNYCPGGLEAEFERDFELPARFHAYWRCEPPAFLARDISGMPMLSCYGVEIEE